MVKLSHFQVQRHLLQSSVIPSHNLLTIMCLTLHLFTWTFILKENLCNYTLVLFIHQVELLPIQKTYLRTTKSLDFPEGQCEGDQCKVAKLQAGIKPTALCSAIDKKNSIEPLLDSLHYLYNYYMVCALLSHTYHMTYHVISCDVTL